MYLFLFSRLDELENEPFYSFSTCTYKLHYYETLNGMRLIMITDLSVQKIQVNNRYIIKIYIQLSTSKDNENKKMTLFI
jgi:hypothetical protein